MQIIIDGPSLFLGLFIGGLLAAIIIDWTDEEMEDKAEMFDRLFSDGLMSKKDANIYMQKLRDFYAKK